MLRLPENTAPPGRGRALSAGGTWMALALLAACGGGGGGGGDSQNTGVELVDPVIPLVGPTGRHSMTPEEANASMGANPPAIMPDKVQSGENQYLRLEVPFDVIPKSVLDNDAVFAPFSYLNGNITISDELGNHIPCIALIDGKDAFGKNRADDKGYPEDLTASGKDLNRGKGTILLVADTGDNDLSTIAAFGGRPDDSDFDATTTDVQEIRISISDLNFRTIDAFYVVNVDDGTNGDIFLPQVVSVVAEMPDPEDPLNPGRAAQKTRFIVQFSEPMVPTTVGKSAFLDGFPFNGNMPILPTPPIPPQPPLPNTHITSTLTNSASPLFIPCDVKPLNSNNLATYFVTPLIDLPPQRGVQLIVVDSNANQDVATGTPVGPMDLFANLHQPGADVRAQFEIGKGRSPVNAPVTPEVLYWVPSTGRGFGAIDLNGQGFTTNTPGANKDDYTKAALITKAYGPGGLNLASGIGILGHPAGAFHNDYRWKVGTGSYTYGAGDPNTPDWEDPNDPGNPGTPVPGINEMSSGYETLVRNADGDVILTGSGAGTVGTVRDLLVGEFLDAAIFDTTSVFNDPAFHVNYYWGAGTPTNTIGNPPSPNPPPSRYWVGLQPIDILIDQTTPGAPARLIEGEEIWSGDKLNDVFVPVVARSYVWVVPNPDSQLLPDVTPYNYDFFIGRSMGPPPQTATIFTPFAARQQIGNYLYVTDGETQQVHVINSNTFQSIETIDLPDPTALAIDPSNRFLLVTNYADDSVSVLGADPTEPDFHQEIARINVGRGPEEIACQSDGEDAFVGNQLSDDISIISLSDLTIRKTIDTLISGPAEIVMAPRQAGFGFFNGVYFAYIANRTGNSVAVFESGPDGPQGIGCDNVLGTVPTEEQSDVEFFEPRGMCYSPYLNDEGVTAGGVFVTHRTNQGIGVVSHVQFTHQIIPAPTPCVPPPGLFFIPPGFLDKTFEIVAQWGLTDQSRLIGRLPTSICLADLRRDYYIQTPSLAPNNENRGFGPGGPNSRHPVRFLPPTDIRFPYVPVVEPDRMYVSFADSDRIQVLDPERLGVSIGEVESAGRTIRQIVGFFSQ